ncbi:hypothetical protein [Photobacterium damselae]|uniref:hypothetical protein n=1 Tax=Photobacterium damselae TaxID=38293 RepID=UPI0013EBF470|nr:hypothetical protein [Photobacterium damselae]QOQ70385.1 hypothetical protein IL982_18015 [Photobacterium damselae subsp. damselae]
MAKLDQKFSKGSKSKFKMDYDDDFQDFGNASRKKRRRVTRQRYDSPEFSNFDYDEY